MMQVHCMQGRCHQSFQCVNAAVATAEDNVTKADSSGAPAQLSEVHAHTFSVPLSTATSPLAHAVLFLAADSCEVCSVPYWLSSCWWCTHSPLQLPVCQAHWRQVHIEVGCCADAGERLQYYQFACFATCQHPSHLRCVQGGGHRPGSIHRSQRGSCPTGLAVDGPAVG